MAGFLNRFYRFYTFIDTAQGWQVPA